jgi:muramoyltetrapeptide carboxypeptidase LdcA involved in peptidoglycan recycling
MTELLCPPALRPGARVAPFTPSYPGPALFPQRFARGLAALRNCGFQIAEREAALNIRNYTSGSPEQRAQELMALYTNSSIDGIICTIGGFNSNAILPFLDFELIRRYPKVLVGYSDVTALLLGVAAIASTVTFHGPAILPEWAEFPAPFEYTKRCFLTVAGGQGPYTYAVPSGWTNDFGDWDAPQPRVRNQVPHSGWRTLWPGSGKGRLLGGNIETMNMLLGTKYFPSWANTILFIEATDAEAYLPRFERALTHLELAGHLGTARAIAVARCPDAVPERGQDLDALLRDLGRRLRIPVIADLDFGHTDPKMTLPVGVEAALTANNDGEVRFELLAPAALAV